MKGQEGLIIFFHASLRCLMSSLPIDRTRTEAMGSSHCFRSRTVLLHRVQWELTLAKLCELQELTVSTILLTQTKIVLMTRIYSAASPGYFTTTFINDIKIEATSTRRSGLIRFTYPASSSNYVVVDLTHDLQRSFEGGSLDIDSSKGRVALSGTFLQVSAFRLITM